MPTGKQIMKRNRTWGLREKARDAEIARLAKERDDLLALVQECSDALGIRDDFVPLGPAIDLAPKIRKALANADKETGG